MKREEPSASTITVHSVLYGVEAYKRLGFVTCGETTTENGIIYIYVPIRLMTK
jgi:predicted GNAT family N-acyltransferase